MQALRVVLSALLLVAGLSVAALADWEFSTPRELGMDSARLEAMTAAIDAIDLPIDSIVVARHGRIAFEYYPDPLRNGPTNRHLLYSVTKSVTSALIGIAIGQGLIESVDAKVVDFFPNRTIANLDERKRSMTLEHLLTMTSGFDWIGPDDMHHSWGEAIRSGDPVQYVLDRPVVHEPGAVWTYNGGCSHLLSAILTEVAVMSTLRFAYEHLFGPLGITNVRWPRDPNGVYYGGQDIWLTPRDMAKLGQLFLNHGVWEGEQVVPAEWVAQSTSTHELSWWGGYGYQWWTFPESGITFAAGAFEQRIYVVPDLDMVVAITASNQAPGLRAGEVYEGTPMVDWLLGRFILPACDTYAKSEYEGYGFSMEIPILMTAEEHGPLGLGEPSDVSGMAAFHMVDCPHETFGLQWRTVETAPNLIVAITHFLESMTDVDTQIVRQELRFSTTLDGQKVAYQLLDVVTGGDEVAAVVGAWYCEETGRLFVLYSGVLDALTEWIDPFATFERLIAGFDGHE
jgi:CubicO group peptidase (beta-lactamase class C family)